MLDWKKLANVDVDKVVREVDLSVLQEFLDQARPHEAPRVIQQRTVCRPQTFRLRESFREVGERDTWSSIRDPTRRDRTNTTMKMMAADS